jgi:hypothetical protein
MKRDFENSPFPFRGIDHPSTQAKLERIAVLDDGTEVIDPNVTVPPPPPQLAPIATAQAVPISSPRK